MRIDLSDEDAGLLKEILTAVISDLSPEIAATDNQLYRTELKARRERLRAVANLVCAVGETQPQQPSTAQYIPPAINQPATRQRLHLSLGGQVRGSDAVCGDLSAVVIDPDARRVTHIVVEPEHGVGLGRLVSIDLLDPSPEGLGLRCTRAEFDKFDVAEETLVFPAEKDSSPMGAWALPWGFFGIPAGMDGMGVRTTPAPVVYDNLPPGEVELRRGGQPHATDGPIGRVEGVIVDPPDHRITHVVLVEGRAWRRKEVSVPITAVSRIEGGPRLNMTRQEVKRLRPVGREERSTWVPDRLRLHGGRAGY
jgi:sporulation protein YlmC with PRC-barrel domain